MKEMKINRRKFMKKAAATALATANFPYIIPAQGLGQNSRVSPSNRITMGFIGVGGMGTNNMRAFINQPDVQILAACDVVKASNEYGHWYKNGWQGPWFGREPAQKIVNDHYSKKTLYCYNRA